MYRQENWGKQGDGDARGFMQGKRLLGAERSQPRMKFKPSVVSVLRQEVCRASQASPALWLSMAEGSSSCALHG